MKNPCFRQPGCQPGAWAAVAALALGLAGAQAQLAITEVMSDPAMTLIGGQLVRQSDWWELTNFGTNEVDLSGYYWTDSGNAPKVFSFEALVIGPGESIIVFRTNNTPNEAQFREWWGPCLSPNVRLRMFADPGFNRDNDGVRVYDSAGNLVDKVDFGSAISGKTFVSDPNSGEFGIYSAPGVCGAGYASNGADLGSPGTTCEPVPLRITAQPLSLLNHCAGADAVFCVQADGLPRPKYQWLSNGAPMPGEFSACLTIPNAQPANAGEYRVVITNGLTVVTSEPAYLTVTTDPSSPQLLSPPSGVERFVGERAVLSPQVCAFPPPVFQWYSNGVAIADATNQSLVFPSVTLAMSGALYRVDIANALGATNTSARLLVHPSPTLEITEVMPAPNTNGTFQTNCNWFELTNRGTNAVPLHLLQHSDRWSLAGAKAVTNRTLLLPGESAIFVEGMSREDFINWWGADHLPLNLIVVTYVGYGLSPYSDSVYVWSIAAESEVPALAGVSWASPDSPPWPPTLPDFCDPELCGHSLYGHSLFFDQTDECYAAFSGRASVEGRTGVFRSAECDDLGSPGWTPWTPPCWTSIAPSNASSLVLSWRAPPGTTHMVQYQSSLQDSNWTTLGTVAGTGAVQNLVDTGINISAREHRYYRIIGLPNGQTSTITVWPSPPPVFRPPIVIVRPPGVILPPWDQPQSLTLAWTAEPPYRYELQYLPLLSNSNWMSDSNWISLGTFEATNSTLTFQDTSIGTQTQRFYRVLCH